MIACKRIEIVIEKHLARGLARRLDELGVTGYTIIADVSGRGDRGRRSADEITDTFSNSLFIIACEDPALAERIVESVRPVLTQSGGICLVSEAVAIRH